MVKNSENTLPIDTKRKVFIPKRHIPNTYNLAGKITIPASYSDPIDPEITKDYFEIVSTAQEADFAIVVIGEPVNGRGYDIEDLRRGGNGYVPMSLQYGDYTATHARSTSIAGGDPKEKTTNRSYKGKTIKTENAGDIDLIKETRKAIGEDKPLIVILPCTKPVISGKYEPTGLLPIQFPANMETVEKQFEDTPRDMIPYTDECGHAYDFAYGLNWSGVINDQRVQKYR